MNSQVNINSPGEKSEFTDNLNLFRQIEFFSGIPLEVVKLFALLCQRTTYGAGDTIFNQGDDDRCSYYIISGNAKLVLESNGKEIEIREYGPEAFFGVVSMLTPIVKQFSLKATEETTCVVMTRKAFSKVVDQFPDVPLIISRSIAQRLVSAEQNCMALFESSGQDEIRKLMGVSLI